MKFRKIRGKKYAIVWMVGMTIMGGVAACTPKDKTTSPTVSASATSDTAPMGTITKPTWKPYSYDEMGIRLELPEEYVKEQLLSGDGYTEDTGVFRLDVNYYSPKFWEVVKEFQSKSEAELTDEVAKEMQDRALQLYKKMMVIYRYPEDQVTKTPAELTGVENATELGRQDGYVYIVYVETNNTTDTLDEASLAIYNDIQKMVPEIRSRITMIPIKTVEEIRGQIPAFSAVDVNGNSVTNDVFKGHKVTMINFWGTFCGPCISEMPDLGKLGKSLPEGAQLIGVVTDVVGDKNLQLAKDILGKADATFLNIVPESGLQTYMSTIQAVPTTIFVDENGNLLGEPLVGSKPESVYRAAIEGFLK